MNTNSAVLDLLECFALSIVLMDILSHLNHWRKTELLLLSEDMHEHFQKAWLGIGTPP